MTAADNALVARRWIDTFNAHDVKTLVSLYDESATHTSPKIRAMHPDTGGCIRGHAELTAWWEGAIGRLPTLRYELVAVTANEDRVFLEYVRHVDGEAPMPVAEVFDVRGGRIVASRVYHG